MPIPLEPVREQNDADLDFHLYDKTGALTVPSTLTYRVDNPDTKASVVPITSITPASSGILTLGSNVTTFQDASKKREKRKVTFFAGYGATLNLIFDCEFEIADLQFVT